MYTYKVRYTAGFGHNTQNHKGFGPTIYIEETIDYKSEKDYFDYIEFYEAYSKIDDTYFHIAWLEDRPLTDKELQQRNAYRKLRDERCEQAKINYLNSMDIDPEYAPTHGD